jgi:predicted transcriptional regulator
VSLRVRRSKNKNRRSLDIAKDILSVASAKVRKTRIMYQANLSYRQLEKYLEDLLGSGVMEFDGDSCYMVTEKGKAFLRMYDAHLERCKQLNEEADDTAKDVLRLESMCFRNYSNGKQEPNGKDAFVSS